MGTGTGVSALQLWLVSGSGVVGFLVGCLSNVAFSRVTGARAQPVRSARGLLLGLGTAAAFALVAWWAMFAIGSSASGGRRYSSLDVAMQGPAGLAAWWIALIAYCAFAGLCILLVVIDLIYKRLPDEITLPGFIGVTALLVLASAMTLDWQRALTTICAAVILFGLYFVVALIRPGDMGGGDVKLSPLVGAVLGFMGWGSLFVGAFVGFVLGAFIGVMLLLLRRIRRRGSLPYGPCMVLGAWVGIVWGEPAWQAFLGFIEVG